MGRKKKSPNDITSIDQDWGKDVSHFNYPFSGKAVQKWIKQQIKELIEQKYAGVILKDGKLKFFSDHANKTDSTLIDEVSLVDVSYEVMISSDHEDDFSMMTSEEKHTVRYYISTTATSFGLQQPDYQENYNVTISIKSANSSYLIRLDNHLLRYDRNGTYIDFDLIKDYLKIGDNYIKIYAKGVTSEADSELELHFTYTTLTFSCDFSWWKAWVGGENFGIDNIRFYGIMPKKLHVMYDDEELVQSFNNPNENYTTTSYTFSMYDKLSSLETGIHNIKVWVEGEGVSTQSVEYDVMVVSAADKLTAKLVVINEVADKATNYENNSSLFKYATYNTTSITADVTAKDAYSTYTIAEDKPLTGITTETKTDYPLSLEIDSFDKSDAFKLDVVLTTPDGHSDEIELPIDNSESFAPAANPEIYFNFSSRTNAEINRTTFINEAPNPLVETYGGTFTNFAWNNDGYATDADGNMALKVSAGSTVSSAECLPMMLVQNGSATIEFMYRASDIADYNTPILTLNEYNANVVDYIGITLYPTRIQVLGNTTYNDVYQSYNLSEDTILHVTIVFQKNYYNTGNCLCRVYVNACPIMNFEFTNTESFGNGYLKFGQDATDFYLYMFRAYSRALEPSDVLANFMNVVKESSGYDRTELRENNDIVDAAQVNYDLCKQRGLNCYVIETESELPSIKNQVELKGINIRLEYADHPEWNVKISGIPIDGQGTTSMKYYRWNLRNKIKSDATWTYYNANGTVRATETGKEGYIAGYGLHPKVSKITAKKNIASSSQGHKMGATGLYNDLWHKFFDGKGLIPSDDLRVAIYQYPFVGFKYNPSLDVYEFIGLFTIGPDKTDSKTFGYDKTTAYPSLMMIEGPDHDPRMTRFLHPWIDVVYDATSKQETLKCGGEDGWDADVAAAYKTDKDQAEIQALFESEFKDAYTLAYMTSPYMQPLNYTGKTIDEINADVSSFQNGTTNGYKNSLLSFYDTDNVVNSLRYNIYYYRTANKRYEPLGIGLLAYLSGYLTVNNPTHEQIQEACAKKFKAEIGKYVNIDEALFHRCFTILIGATDNEAKNTYWRKFKSIEAGGRWGFNQDDLDTIGPTDNNGQSTKSYSVEPGDELNGNEIFQGSSSAFWTRINISYQEEIRSAMTKMFNHIDEIATEQGLSGSFLYQRALKVMSYYFWDHSAKYFPQLAYVEDTAYSYLTPWQINHSASYNNVKPLTQALGTQYDAEYIWFQRRIAYVISKYRLQGFGGPHSDYGSIEFTPSNTNTASFSVTPAIDLYPRLAVGTNLPAETERTSAGNTCVVYPSSTGATTNYLIGVDWYSYIGDISKMVLTNRSGSSSTAVDFTVHSKRLRTLKVGDKTSEVLFNATSIGISGNCLEEIDARNVSTLTGPVDLLSCPRLRRAYFGGTRIGSILLPVGSKVSRISLPTTVTTLFLNSLPMLTTAGIDIDGYSAIESLYINNCEKINPCEILRKAIDDDDSSLKYVTIIWDTINGTGADVNAIAKLAKNIYDTSTGKGYGSVTYDATNNIIGNSTSKPTVQGTIVIEAGGVYASDIALVESTFPNLTVINKSGKTYIEFEDPEVLKVLLENGISSDGIGVTIEDALRVTSF